MYDHMYVSKSNLSSSLCAPPPPPPPSKKQALLYATSDSTTSLCWEGKQAECGLGGEPTRA